MRLPVHATHLRSLARNPVQFLADLSLHAARLGDPSGEPENDPAVRAAVEEFARLGRLSRGDVPDAYQRVLEIRQAARELTSAPSLPSTPIFRRLADQWREHVDELARRLRTSVFGSPSAPWSPETYADAVSWIEAQLEAQRAAFGDEDPSLLALEDDEVRQLTRLQLRFFEATGVALSVSPNRLYLEYTRLEDGRPTRALVRGSGAGSRLMPEPPLARIAKLSVDLSAALGVAEHTVTAFTLTGRPLPFRRASVHGRIRTVPAEDWPAAPRVSVDFHSPDVTNKAMRSIKSEVQAMFGRLLAAAPSSPSKARKRGPVLTAAQEAMIVIATQSGGVPPRPIPLEFWRTMARRSCELGPDCRAPKTAEAWRKSFERLERKAPRLGVLIPRQPPASPEDERDGEDA